MSALDCALLALLAFGLGFALAAHLAQKQLKNADAVMAEVRQHLSQAIVEFERSMPPERLDKLRTPAEQEIVSPAKPGETTG